MMKLRTQTDTHEPGRRLIKSATTITWARAQTDTPDQDADWSGAPLIKQKKRIKKIPWPLNPQVLLVWGLLLFLGTCVSRSGQLIQKRRWRYNHHDIGLKTRNTTILCSRSCKQEELKGHKFRRKNLIADWATRLTKVTRVILGRRHVLQN